MSIECYNGIIKSENIDVDILDRMVRRAVMDAEIPILKPIAYSISSKNLNRIKRDIKLSYRHNDCLESYIDIGQSLQDVVFKNTNLYGDESMLVYVEKDKGPINRDSIFINSNNQKSLNILTTNDSSICTARNSILLKICAIEHTGYLPMSKSQDIATSLFPQHRNDLFFLNTYFNISEYVKILPFDGENVRYRLKRGMDEIFFQTLLLKWERNIKWQ